MATVEGGFPECRAPAKHTTGIAIPTAIPQIKILTTLSLILMSHLTLGKSFNLSLQMRKLRLCVLIELAQEQRAPSELTCWPLGPPQQSGDNSLPDNGPGELLSPQSAKNDSLMCSLLYLLRQKNRLIYLRFSSNTGRIKIRKKKTSHSTLFLSILVCGHLLSLQS